MRRSTLLPPLRLVFFMWLFYSIQVYSGVDMGFLGILPLEGSGLVGVFLAPLIHGSVSHLMSNTLPLLFLGTMVYYFYQPIATQVMIHCYFFTNILVWFFGRPFYHIGASGLVYGLAFFLISFGIFRREARAIIISLIVILIYGGLVYGILPSNPNISWESHLMGAIVGIGSAFGLSKLRKVNS
ncbi:rhomboid family intramembrane serine protease [Marinoscillum sp. MHG1-6]|uniref:rhomboid family intramembrane serine protease n=1 Tax=Marinoscillum sp. MHG1-6 TaxID=2959627 RepID=UPI00215884FF|nr:rhomboid family intramembrane serine protease [Marinoscillum sp. MHG1-6]